MRADEALFNNRIGRVFTYYFASMKYDDMYI